MSNSRLYGRNREVAFLREWCTLTASTLLPRTSDGECTRSPLLLLGGARGVGKRAVAHSLGTHEASSHSLFLSGRFYPVRAGCKGKRRPPDRPLRAVWDALNGVFDKVSEPSETKALKAAILYEFQDSDDIETLMQMMSGFRRLLQERRTSNVGATATSAAPVRMFVESKRLLNKGSATLAKRFVRAISTIVPKFVMCIEHLECADSATYELIEDLLRDVNTRGLFQLIATYRDDADFSQPMEQLLTQTALVPLDQPADCLPVESQPNSVIRIQMTDLNWDDVYQWTKDCFRRKAMSEDMLQSLVDLVFEKSAGNPQRIFYLHGYLARNIDVYQCHEEDLATIRTTLSASLDELLVQITEELAPTTRGVVEAMAAFGECSGGESIDMQTLDLVLRRSCHEDVAAAQASGIFAGSHVDKICLASVECQRLAYDFIPESRRASFHLKIGRRLWKSLPSPDGIIQEDDLSYSFLFLGAQNLQRGIDLVTDIDELDLIVNISIAAGKRAMLSSMFPLAAFYFELAISALGDRLWQTELYEVSLALYNGISEALYCCADFEAVDRMLQVVFENAKTFEDKLQAYSTLIYAHSARHRLLDALNLSAYVLGEVGEHYPTNPSNYQVWIEYYKVRRLLRGKNNRFFLSLPVATNPNKVIAHRMMLFVSFNAYGGNPNLAVLMVLRLMQSALEFGTTGPAVAALSFYAYFLSIHMGRIHEGVRFAKLSLEFLDQGEGLPWLPRIYFLAQGLTLRTFLPFRDNLEPLRKANRLALQSGDMEGSMYVSIALIPLLLHAGTPLGSIEDELRAHIKLMVLLGQELALSYLVPMWQVICDFMGGAPFPLNLAGEIKDAHSAFVCAKEQNNLIAMELGHSFQALYHCLMGDFVTCLDLAEKSRIHHSIFDVWTVFFEGLAALAQGRNVTGIARRRFLVRGRKAAKTLTKLTGHCQDNFGSKEALLKAEIAAIKGNVSLAMMSFNTAIKLAKKQGFLLEEGLGYERLGLFQSALGSSEAAVPFFESARSAYERWGAQALVARMDQQLALSGGTSNDVSN